MIYSDLHTHTRYSEDVPFDLGASVDMLCLAALEKGIGEIAVTDHYEMNTIVDGLSVPPDLDSVYKEVTQAKEKYDGKVNVLFGIELGQPTHKMKEASELLKKYPFEFVIGSVHGVRGIIDFYSVDYSAHDESALKALFYRYIDELTDTAAHCDFDTLAHITYPLRYYKSAGKLDLLDVENKGKEYFESVFKKLIERGKALEINTSGLRQNLNSTLPDDKLIAFYRELGGELITLGSDAHRASHVGSDIVSLYSHLKDFGFEYVSRFENRKMYFEKL